MRLSSSIHLVGSALLLALLSACGNSADQSGGTESLADSSTGSTPTNASTLSATATETATLSAISTVTNSATADSTNTQTASATAPQTSTETATATLTQTSTITATQTATQSSTATRTDSGTILSKGLYDGKACYPDLLASLTSGRSLYSLASYRFGENGKGDNSFSLFEDPACTRLHSKNKARITYTTSTYFERLLLIAIEQPIDPKNNISFPRYWIAALVENDQLLFDIDSSRGARGPYLSLPSESELRATLEGMERRAAVFQKK